MCIRDRIQHTAKFAGRGQAAALEESFADVMGSLVRQWALGQTVAEADWMISPRAGQRSRGDTKPPVDRS